MAIVGLFDAISGLTLVDPADLEDFKRVMEEEVIPEIVRVMQERAEAAVKSRAWILHHQPKIYSSSQYVLD